MKDLIIETEETLKISSFNLDKIGIGDCIEYTISNQLSNYKEDEYENLPKKGIGIISEIFDFDDYKLNGILKKQQVVTIRNESHVINFRTFDLLERNVSIKMIKSVREYKD